MSTTYPAPAPFPAAGSREPVPEQPRFVLGLKVKTLRHGKGFSLKQVSGRSGLSVSYLSEIEKGKKYPGPEKLIDLARALDVPFDTLVSLQVNESLSPLKALFASSFVKEFPFDLFGVKPEDLFGLITHEPEKAGALIRTFLEVGRTYDVEVEHFLLAALRSYQQMNSNYFPDLEEAATAFRSAHGWTAGEPPQPVALQRVLERDYGYKIDERALARDRELHSFRSVYREGKPPTLFINRNLMPSQKAFLLARELGYRRLGLKERALTSSWLKVESFEQVLNNFKASYFAGAVMIERDRLRRDLELFFSKERWDREGLVSCMRRYRATPETFFHRITQILPKLFDLPEIYFMRFNSEAGKGRYNLTKVLNMSPVPVPHGVGLDETYCRRWPAMKLLDELARSQRRGRAPALLVGAQRSRFLDEEADFFVMSMARPLALAAHTNSSVDLGLLVNDAFRERVRFWNDRSVPSVVVNLTCERCRLTPAECADRAAPQEIFRRQELQARKERALAALLEDFGPR